MLLYTETKILNLIIALKNCMLVFDHLNSSLSTIFYDLFKPFNEQQFFEENDAQWKAAELERLHDAIREKLKNSLYPEKIQILTLIPMVTRVRIKTI